MSGEELARREAAELARRSAELLQPAAGTAATDPAATDPAAADPAAVLRPAAGTAG